MDEFITVIRYITYTGPKIEVEEQLRFRLKDGYHEVGNIEVKIETVKGDTTLAEVDNVLKYIGPIT